MAKPTSRRGKSNLAWDTLTMTDERPAETVKHEPIKSSEVKEEEKRESVKITVDTPQKPAEKKEAPKKEIKVSAVTEKKRGVQKISMKDVLAKKKPVPITLSKRTKDRLSEICEQKGISMSSAIQIMTLSYFESPSELYKEDADLLEEIIGGSSILSMTLEDAGTKRNMSEEDKRSIGTYTLAPIVDQYVSEKTEELGLEKKMRSRVYEAIVDRYLDVKI